MIRIRFLLQTTKFSKSKYVVVMTFGNISKITLYSALLGNSTRK